MRRFVVLVVAATALVLASTASARVLLVGNFHGIKGQYRSIQAAVNAAKRGDWILVAPGDYKTHSSRAPKGRRDRPAGILITTPGIRLRGMNRNTVIVDGTRSGKACNSKRSEQNFGPNYGKGTLGLNGIMVYKANNVWVQNLTACNFLGGSGGDGGTGNEIWWNGGDESGQIGGWGFTGSYLNATSTFFQNETTAAEYGIFSSNWDGGTWNQSYASNFNDSGYYIGACQQVCDQTVNHAWGEYNALGYSGSNSGGQLVVENSQFDNNEDGFSTNSQNGDNPPPQDGACPDNGISPITHTHSCWVFMHNYVHNNNNPNIPSAGSAAAGPVGTGISLAGSRNDTITDNRFVDNDAWGVIVIPYPDSGPPCTGGTPGFLGAGSCLFDDWGDAVLDNRFSHDGGYGHPSNGDIAWLNFESGHPTPCFAGNTDQAGTLTTSPSNLQQNYPSCNGSSVPANDNSTFLNEVLCDSQVSLGSGPPSCPSGPYPRRTRVIMHRLPPAKQLSTMPNPCAGVPSNPWCRAGKPV